MLLLKAQAYLDTGPLKRWSSTSVAGGSANDHHLFSFKTSLRQGKGGLLGSCDSASNLMRMMIYSSKTFYPGSCQSVLKVFAGAM